MKRGVLKADTPFLPETIHRDRALRQGARAARRTPSATMSPKTTDPTILVVDDEPSILDVLGRFAEGGGFTVVTCGSGADALAS